MSTLYVNNIAEIDATVPSDNSVSGVLKMWANCASGYASINLSFNTSGITDLGTGNPQIDFASDMANGSYASAAACDASEIARYYATIDSHGTATIDIAVFSEHTGSTIDRDAYVHVTGELA